MKITDIKATVIRARGDSVLVRVYTDEGICGLGECAPLRLGSEALKSFILGMKPLLVGQDPRDVDRLYELMRRRYILNGAIAGLIITAISGIELALWDIAGKAAGLPVYRLLGGKFRDRIRLYDDFGTEGQDPAAYAKEALRKVALGFTAIKFDVDGVSPGKFDAFNRSVSPKELAHILSLVRAVREAIGPEVELAVDCHGAFDTGAAIKLAAGMEEFNLLWLEEPVPPENVEALAKVTASTRTPICVGESLFTRFGFRELLQAQAVSIIMPDVPKVGGILEARKIADIADTYYIPMAPHNLSTPIATMAAVHLCAAIPNFLVLEFHSDDLPWWEDLATCAKPIARDGYIEVPQAPGLGVELNEEVARGRLKEGETLFA